ncbi:MAG: right-handed parallel beta-helix repeat-containing protein [Bacteroidia bacterium]|nr:right-handed parallel beta-helix repeat-containing protein [Bacteroidia bacterium]
MKLFTLFIAVWVVNTIYPQMPSYRLGDWKNVGSMDSSFPSKTVYLDDFSRNFPIANPDSTIQVALLSLKNQGGGTLIINPGTYIFHSSIQLYSQIRVKGFGKLTNIHFDFNSQNKNGFIINGASIGNNINIDSINGYKIFLHQAPNDTSIRLFKLGFNDSDKMNNDWAYGSAGQLLRVKSINGNIVTVLDSPFSGDLLSRNAYLKAIIPVEHAAIECLHIERLDSSFGQSSNIYINYGLNCTISGIESSYSNFSHISINQSSQCRIERNYFHHSFGYGGGGRGYGVVLQMGAYKNLVQNNQFFHLRHSILLQSGANNNVISYNYSKEPFVTDNIFTDAGGDLVCHGNYVYRNLFEGNICQTITIDNSHGKNGPYNTFFRNRAELYGILISTSQDSQNFIANEITNTASLKGQFIINGTGHFRNSNSVRGVISDGNKLYPNSLYLNELPNFWNIPYNFWGIGTPFTYLHGSNPAQQRQLDSLDFSPCSIPIRTTNLQKISVLNHVLYPNPIERGQILHFNSTYYSIQIMNLHGTILQKVENQDAVNTEFLNPGLYVVLLNGKRSLLLSVR